MTYRCVHCDNCTLGWWKVVVVLRGLKITVPLERQGLPRTKCRAWWRWADPCTCLPGKG